jgi:hypothetical protein
VDDAFCGRDEGGWYEPVLVLAWLGTIDKVNETEYIGGADGLSRLLHYIL